MAISLALASLLNPYQGAITGEPTTPASLGMMSQIGQGLGGGLMDMADRVGSMAGGMSGADPEANRWEQMAANMAQQQYGWGPSEFDLIDQIISRESNWNPNAVNASSGAYGIPQILPAAHPDDLGLGPRQQISWLLDYIKGRYGSPSEAWDFKQQTGWY